MISILSDIEFVKRKIEGGETFAGSVLTTHNQQPRGSFPASVEYNPVVITENTTRVVLTALEGKRDPLWKTKSDLIGSDPIGSGFSGGGEGGDSPLLDSIVISRQEISMQRLKDVYQENEKIEFEKSKKKRENCNTKVVTLECKTCGFQYLALLGCGLRTCPDCSRDRANKCFIEIYNIVKRVKLKKYWSLKMITFSYGFEQYTSYSAVISKITQAFTKIWRNILQQKGAGAVVSIELGEKNLSIHLHCLYYGGFIPRETLIKEWKKHTGKWYVDIRMIRGLKGIREVIKYITKGLLDMSYERAFEIEKALKGHRRFITYGIFYNRLQQEKKFECPLCHSQDWRYVDTKDANVGTNETMLMQRQFFRELSEVSKNKGFVFYEKKVI